MTDLPLRSPVTASHGPAFLELGERLRQRGQLAAAETVCLAGLATDPALAAAHDLLGRIRADRGDDPGATAAWRAALECDPACLGARKGLAFLAFRGRDFAAAERHLESAVIEAPHDASILAALDRVRSLRGAESAEPPPSVRDPSSGLVVFDLHGLRLAGGGADPAADAVAAEAAGLMREAQRAARLLSLGAIRYVVIETRDVRLAMVPVDRESALLVQRTAATPLGRLLSIASRAVPAALAAVAGEA